MTDQDDYLLRRDYSASVRLNAQHADWTNIFGYLIHPSIPLVNGSEGLSIIDVGTGTGNWLLAVSQQLKDTHVKTLLGTDISDSQYPHHTWLPEKVKLIKLNALDPNGPPEELRGQFDIVHARLLISLVKDNKPDQLIDFFSQLLKPGGYVQWGEPHYKGAVEVEPARGSGRGDISTDGLHTIINVIKDSRPSAWTDQIDKCMEPFGFEIVTVDRRASLPWQRGWWLYDFCMIVDEIAPQLGIPLRKARELTSRAVTESKQGSWIKYQFQTIIARKKP